MKNKPWKKPELVVLTRSKPEEGVLSFCKWLAPNDSGPNAAAAACVLIGCPDVCNINVES